MRTFFITTALLFSFANTFAQVIKSKLKISHLTGNYYIYTTYNTYEGYQVPANGMYVVTNKGVVMFDTPWDTTQFQPLLDSIQLKHNKKSNCCFCNTLAQR